MKEKKTQKKKTFEMGRHAVGCAVSVRAGNAKEKGNRGAESDHVRPAIDLQPHHLPPMGSVRLVLVTGGRGVRLPALSRSRPRAVGLVSHRIDRLLALLSPSAC